MKRFLLLHLCLVAATTCFCQSKNYLLDGSRWVYETQESYEPGQIFIFGGTEENTIQGDTLLNGVLYKKLYKRFVNRYTTTPPFPNQPTVSLSYGSLGPEFIRYDSLENKVFYKVHTDSLEILIYDYNLDLGDTIAMLDPLYSHQRNTILEKDSIHFYGKVHNVFLTDTDYIPYRNGIIEGIGGLNGLTYNQPSYAAVSGGILMTELICFEYQDSTLFAPWALQQQLPCPPLSFFVLSSVSETLEPAANVIPNPNNGSFSLEILEDFGGSQLSIFNEMGSVMNIQKIESKQISFDNYPSGWFIWNITPKNGNPIQGRFLVIN